MVPAEALFGRSDVVEALTAHALAGETVLLLGPVGIGKSAVLHQVASEVARAGRPKGQTAALDAISGLTAALAAAYPMVVCAGGQRALRAELRRAAMANPGVLLLDGLGCVGGELKHFLRELRGTGVGILLAADAEHARDRSRLRQMRLAYREHVMPPLAGRHLRAILAARCRCPLRPHDVEKLVALARGRPGFIVEAAAQLGEPRFWDGDRARLETVALELEMRAAGRYLRTQGAD